MYKLAPQKLDILSLGRYLFIYSVVSVKRNIVRYNKYLVVVTVVVVFVSYCYIYVVISLEHSTVVIGVFKLKFECPIYSIFRKKFNRTRSVSTINTEENNYYAAGLNGSGRQLNH